MTTSPEPTSPSHSVDLQSREDVTVVRGTGELDLASEPALDAALAQAAGRAVPTIVDLTEVSFCASGTFNQLYTAATAAADQGVEFVIATAQRAVLRPMEILQLDKHLTVVPDVDAAHRALTSARRTAPDIRRDS